LVTVKANPFKSVIVADKNGNDLRIDEGNYVEFSNEDGEVVKGILSKITGKKSVKFTINPPDTQRQEIWCLDNIAEGSINII
jgi:hypothetical protein